MCWLPTNWPTWRWNFSATNTNTEAAVGPGSWGSPQWWLVWLGMTLRARGVLQAEPFKFLNLGLLTYIGGSEAVAQVQLGTAGGNAFLLWRSVYLVKQVSTRTRLLVLLDFIKSKVLGRDLTDDV
mmetsp:Transcript_9111/g.13589  ORF Transcript_9111/g.13589 Transcript_9111/m.13589 type:complete len:125 (+) Transcript_9111:841-1215(+)